MNDPFSDILGQSSAVQAIRNSLDGDRIAAAYLFDGPSGVGKEKTALAFARIAVAQGDAAIAKRIDEGNHPDVRVFKPRDEGDRNIKVDFIRTEILPLTQFAPFEAKRAFFIFPDADVSFPDSHPQAANALLKTLEEAKPNVAFILTATRSKRLLPTIRSRSQRLRFAPLESDVLKSILRAEGVDDADHAAAIALCGGRADLAISLGQEGYAATLMDLAVRTHDAIQLGAPGTITNLAEEIAKHDEFPMPLFALQTLYRDICCAGLGLDQTHLRYSDRTAKIEKAATVLKPEEATARVDMISAQLRSLEHNANKQISMDALFHGMARARR